MNHDQLNKRLVCSLLNDNKHNLWNVRKDSARVVIKYSFDWRLFYQKLFGNVNDIDLLEDLSLPTSIRKSIKSVMRELNSKLDVKFVGVRKISDVKPGDNLLIIRALSSHGESCGEEMTITNGCTYTTKVDQFLSGPTTIKVVAFNRSIFSSFSIKGFMHTVWHEFGHVMALKHPSESTTSVNREYVTKFFGIDVPFPGEDCRSSVMSYCSYVNMCLIVSDKPSIQRLCTEMLPEQLLSAEDWRAMQEQIALMKDPDYKNSCDKLSKSEALTTASERKSLENFFIRSMFLAFAKTFIDYYLKPLLITLTHSRKTSILFCETLKIMLNLMLFSPSTALIMPAIRFSLKYCCRKFNVQSRMADVLISIVTFAFGVFTDYSNFATYFANGAISGYSGAFLGWVVIRRLPKIHSEDTATSAARQRTLNSENSGAILPTRRQPQGMRHRRMGFN